MCLVCGTILINDSTKNVKLEQYQKSKHLSSVGTEGEHCENEGKRQTAIRLCKDDEYC